MYLPGRDESFSMDLTIITHRTAVHSGISRHGSELNGEDIQVLYHRQSQTSIIPVVLGMPS